MLWQWLFWTYRYPPLRHLGRRSHCHVCLLMDLRSRQDGWDDRLESMLLLRIWDRRGACLMIRKRRSSRCCVHVRLPYPSCFCGCRFVARVSWIGNWLKDIQLYSFYCFSLSSYSFSTLPVDFIYAQVIAAGLTSL